MTSELLASSSEIHANDTKIFQLKALSLNFLRNTSEITDEHIPKLNPCHFCNKEILTLPLPLHSFTVLLCGHIYHQICFEKHIELSLASEDEDSLAGQGGKRTEITTEISSRTNREQERFRGLLHELSTSIKGETTETNNEDEGSGSSILQNLAQLFQKEIKAEKHSVRVVIKGAERAGGVGDWGDCEVRSIS
ncbi:11730_t:CDS:2 [Funneliformis mosseae]|uniref:11730_t:CDS:1 n=1 Tax=Funneliformis mosseae TaxID=27381 RepID=A0A9N9D747_FUNMO|nr:11730_t:CDS:2 [Funneliformis mosseae]